MYLSSGNIKLNKCVLVWNLPRITTCPGAGACKDWCYEIKAEKRFKGAVASRRQNLNDSKRKDFVPKMVALMKRRNFKYVRVHASGDFYNQTYLNKWYEIARQLPDKKFYAFTKSLHLSLWRHQPKNFKIIQSYGGKWDSKINPMRAYNRVIDKGDPIMSWEFLCASDSLRDGTCGGSCTKCQEDHRLCTVSHRH